MSLEVDISQVKPSDETSALVDTLIATQKSSDAEDALPVSHAKTPVPQKLR